MVEYFVHIDPVDAPNDLILVAAAIPSSVSSVSISTKQLPANWRSTPAPPELARIGDQFARDGKAAILIVPSAIAPDESNWLINPNHPHAHKIRVARRQSFRYDDRFFG